MSIVLDPETSGERALLVSAAKQFHLEQRSKTEIAKQLGISRFKVARLLERARESGVVRIEIDESASMMTPIANELIRAYDLKTAVVVPTPSASSSERKLAAELGRAAAKTLARVLTERDILGIGWGRTISACLPFLEPLPRCPVVQLSGMAGDANYNSTEVVRQIASTTKGPAFPMYAPLLLPDRQTTEALRANSHISAAFTMHEHLTLVLIAIGSWSPPNSQLRLMLSRKELSQLERFGIRTEMGGILLDDNGRQVVPELSERVLAIDKKTLARVPTVIGVAGGRTKHRAIKVALNSRTINGLVTDSETAAFLLR